MKHHTLPAIWLIILIVGLPLLSETVYTPSLPDIAHALGVSDSWVEYTLTIYLAGFALGTLIWGKLSDKGGRKPYLVIGFSLYLVGCLGCYLSDSIAGLLACRFIQALGGSVGSVLGQAICRDAFHGPALGKIYASVGGALAIFPALGPIIGGMIDQQFGWPAVFLFLMGFGSLVLALVLWFLPETHKAEQRHPVPVGKRLAQMARDRSVLGFGLLVAAANGVTFSYYAEAPFYMIELLGLSPTHYGFTFIGIALATLCAGLWGRWLHSRYASKTILTLGLGMMGMGSLLFLGAVLLPLPKGILLTGSLAAMMVVMGGITLVTSNALSLALVAYKHAMGTASSLFGFFYYTGVSVFTGVMGYCHNGTLLPMPLYFCGISVFMVVIYKSLLK